MTAAAIEVARTLLTRAETLDPVALKEWVKNLTRAELDVLVQRMDEDRKVPDVFANPEIKQALEERMEAVGISRDSLNGLRQTVEAKTEEVEKEAEGKFKSEFFKKGGVWAVAGTAAVSFLAWLGFKKFKNLKESLSGKGFLRTAVEGAAEHPLFAAFLIAIGVRAGTDAYRYFTDNRDAVETHIKKEAEKTGKSPEETVHSLADKVRNGIQKGVDVGLKGIVVAVTYAFGGTYDEETGVVTLPHSTLRPPVVMAWQAGVRRNGGPTIVRKAFSRFLVEDRLQTILRDTKTTQTQHSEVALGKQRVAKRALELLSQGAIPGGGPEGLELERCFMVLETELNLKPSQAVHEVHTKRADVEKNIKLIEQQMDGYLKSESRDFRQAQGDINNELMRADQEIAKGAPGTNIEARRNEAVKKAQQRIADHQNNLSSHKIAFGKQLESALNDVQIGVGDQVGQTLDSRHGGDKLSRGLETTVKSSEKLGYSFAKIPGGKWVMRGVIGYSFLPLAAEGIAALRPGEAGKQAQEAFLKDAAEAVGGFIPGVGEVLDFRSAIMGRDLNGRELGTWDRVVAGSMGTLGTVSIVAGFFTGGATIVGFRALRGAVSGAKAINVARKVDKGVTAVSVTAREANRVLKLQNRATDSAKALENMAKVTDAQRIARTVKGTAQNLQRMMQVVTYGHLGVQLASGAVSLYDNAAETVGRVQEGAMHAVDAFESFASGAPKITPPAQL